MNENRELAPNVIKFLEYASISYGKIKANQFSQDLFCQLIEGQIKSPIVASGYRVLHFTGSEVFSDPVKVAHEALAMVGFDNCSAGVFDPLNPFGIE